MKKKTVVITGASRGIGSKMAELFAENNYNVVINYHQSEKQALDLETKLLAQNYSVTTCQADVRKKVEVDQLIEYAIQTYSSVELLINNAGIAKQELINDCSLATWNDILATNLTAAFMLTQSVLPYMLSAKAGKIINISSIWGIIGASMEVAYSTSKAGLIGFTKALAKELAPSGIQVNCIAPGAIKTDMLSGFTQAELDEFAADTPLGRIGSTDDIAQLALFLASDKSNFITGQVISPNGGVVI